VEATIVLENEIAFYNENLPDWLRQYRKRFVLIKGENLIGTFDTDSDALTEGARLFGRESFLVRRVEERQPNASLPALALGILRADTPRTDFRTSARS